MNTFWQASNYIGTREHKVMSELSLDTAALSNLSSI